MSQKDELRRTFRPAVIIGDPRVFRRAHRRHLRLVDTEDETPIPMSSGSKIYGLTNMQMAFLVLGAVAAGGIVGWFWRKKREREAVVKRPRDLVGLDVIVSSSE